MMETKDLNIIPEGYIVGANRGFDEMQRPLFNVRVSHIYKGNFNDPGKPMCDNCYNSLNGYSILRNRIGKKGVCKVCLKRAIEGLNGLDPKLP